MPLKTYTKTIQDIHHNNPNAKEHSYRTPLQNLWETLYGKDFPILHEGSSEKGTPDFTVSNQSRHLVGYIECKDYGFDLQAAIDNKKGYQREHKQLVKYLTLAPVVIFTNYTDFILVSQGLTILAEAHNPEDLEALFRKFVQAKPVPINNQDTFIKIIAEKTRILRDDILAECKQADSYFSKSEIHQLFSKTIYKDLDQKDFADSFAQIVTFGLLFTRLSDRQPVSLDTFQKIPQFLPLFKELLSKFDFAEAEGIRYILDSLIETINLYDETMFNRGKNYKDNHDQEDPFIYLYENFLKEFDASTRNARGVFYTPIEVVRYMIRSIDELLKTRLDLNQGLRHQDVHILDFATGTGTFLLGAIEYIYRDLENSGSTGLWKSQVKDFILKNLYGFEYLVVPYVLAHFRIHQYLEDCDYTYEKSDRLKLYLTNTLDNSSSATIPMFPELNKESADAYRIKNEEPILVIMGNPPYNSSSDPMNCGDWIMKLTNSYKEGLNEKKINLNDDYIKFIRFAHHKMEKIDKGMVAVIVNNSFLKGLGHRIMRQQLMETFDEIYIYDLHGNVNKGEKCPDGSTDFNIFNIASAGVCIAFLIKTGKKDHRGVYYQELFGTQIEKKKALLPCSWKDDQKDQKWQQLEDDKKWHWFVPRQENTRYWEDFRGLHEIFDNMNSGIETKRDNISINYTQDELTQVLEDFSQLEETQLLQKYQTENSRDWTILGAKDCILNKKGTIQMVQYRPFDFRWTYYHPTSKGFLGYPRYDTMKHLIGQENVGLVFPRQVAGGYGFQHGLVTNVIIDRAMGGAKTGSETNIAPLYLYTDSEEHLGFNQGKTPNWTEEFAKFLQSYHSDCPEHILAYLYAILFAPSYRQHYAEDLSYDYPRVPFTSDKNKFTQLADLGQSLIDLHLLNSSPTTQASYPIDGDHLVKALRYAQEKIFINENQYFEGISMEVWAYQIGGYQVLDKWLKSRKGRFLSVGEITHFQQICGVIADTIAIQQQIDQIKGVW
ncbi:MAG: type ISP restriction/modification enzyme [Brevinema sp.]